MARAAPRGLGSEGRRLWRSYVTHFELDPGELQLLEHAARTADIVAKLDNDLEGKPSTSVGSKGQVVVNPLLVEVRQQRLALRGLLRGIRLPTSGVVGVGSGARSAQARAAALTRWRGGA